MFSVQDLINLFGKAAALSDALANQSVVACGANLLVWNGVSWSRVRTSSTWKDQSTVTITSAAAVWTPASGKTVRLLGGAVSASAAGSILFQDGSGSGATVFRTPVLASATPYNFDLPGGRSLSAANNALYAILSVAGSFTGTLWGCEE